MLLTLFLFPMAGLPPLAGFFAKFYIIVDLVHQAHFYSAGFLVVMSGLGIYYTLKIIAQLYFGQDESAKSLISYAPGCIASMVSFVLGALIVVVGCYPALLLYILQ